MNWRQIGCRSWLESFALIPTKMHNGKWVWLRYYMQDQNGSEHYANQEEI